MASHRKLAAPKSGCSQQVLFTTVLPIILIYSHFIKSSNLILCPSKTHAHTCKPTTGC